MVYEGKVKTVEKDRQLTKDPSLQIPCVHPSKEQYGTVGMGRSRIIYIYIYIYGERERFRYYAAVRSTLGRQLQLFTKIFKGMMLDLKMM